MVQAKFCLFMAMLGIASAKRNSQRFVAQQALRSQICEQEGSTYDPATGRCFDPRKEPSEYNCALVQEHYDAESQSCMDNTTNSSNKLDKRFIAPGSLDTPSTAACKAMDLIYNPATQKCFNPSRHPSVCNCAYLGLNFNAATNDCQWDAGSQAANVNCQTMTLLYNPNTQKCYSPARHPSVCNCEYYSLTFSSYLNACVPYTPSLPGNNLPTTVAPPSPATTDSLPVCQPGSLPDYNTKQCVSCGSCMSYPLNVGQQVCTSGQCSIICPDGTWAQNRWGIQYCQ